MNQIPPFQMPFDLSQMEKPTMEALDANFDYVGEYMKTQFFPALTSAAARITELEARVQALESPVL